MSSIRRVNEDLSDMVERQDRVIDAYVHELRLSLGETSTEVRFPALKAPRLNRKGFHKAINKPPNRMTHEASDSYVTGDWNLVVVCYSEIGRDGHCLWQQAVSDRGKMREMSSRPPWSTKTNISASLTHRCSQRPTGPQKVLSVSH